MSQFSLVNAYEHEEDRVFGSWMQDHYGTLESATEAAEATERANSNRIRVMVCEPFGGTTPMLDGPKWVKLAKDTS